MPDCWSSSQNSSRLAMSRRMPSAQLAGPVPADGARDVALLVGGGVDVDLDESHVRVVEVLLGPVGVDEDVVGVAGDGHDGAVLLVATAGAVIRRGRAASRAAGARSTRTGPARRHAQRPAGRGRRRPAAGMSASSAGDAGRGGELVERVAAGGAARCAWLTIHGSTRLESSIVTVSAVRAARRARCPARSGSRPSSSPGAR